MRSNGTVLFWGAFLFGHPAGGGGSGRARPHPGGTGTGSGAGQSGVVAGQRIHSGSDEPSGQRRSALSQSQGSG